MQTTQQNTTMKLVSALQEVREMPGIFAMWCQEATRLTLLSVQPTDNLKLSLQTYYKLQDFRLNTGNKIIFSIRYMQDSTPIERELLAKNIRKTVLEKRIEKGR